MIRRFSLFACSSSGCSKQIEAKLQLKLEHRIWHIVGGNSVYRFSNRSDFRSKQTFHIPENAGNLAVITVSNV